MAGIGLEDSAAAGDEPVSKSIGSSERRTSSGRPMAWAGVVMTEGSRLTELLRVLKLLRALDILFDREFKGKK